MPSSILTTYYRLLKAAEFKHHRYLFNEFSVNNKLTGLIGPRGAGKTTLLLQFIKEKMPDPLSCIYASVDNIYFSRTPLIDFVEELYDYHGIRYFFLDEIHKYPDWNQEIKNIYDSYPEIKIVFSGSSSIDLIKGSYDLSRRGILFRMGGMSFREYLQFNDIADIPSFSFDKLLNDRKAIAAELAGIKRLKGHFKEYLGKGYYPFILEDDLTYSQKVLNIINKTIFEDIPNYYRLRTDNLSNFKKILSFLATIPPGDLNIHTISRSIGLDHKTIQHYVTILHETGLAEIIHEQSSGSSLLKHKEKMYLDNPDLYKSIIDEIGYSANTGTLREIFFIRMLRNAGNHVHYARTGDFEVNGMNFEVGGKNKGLKQIRQKLDNSLLVKDDILHAGTYEIPLHLFGFLY